MTGQRKSFRCLRSMRQFGASSRFHIVCFISFLLSLKLVVSADSKMEQEFECISKSCSHFSSNFLLALTSEHTQNNVVSSSLSIHIILSLLFYGADGVTQEELKSALKLLDPEKAQSEFKNLLTVLNAVKNVELKIANAMYVDNNFVLKEEFLTKSQNNHQTLVKNVNFQNNIDSADIINTWVKENTKGKISNIINSNDIDTYTKVILLNAIYFKSNWLNKFDPELIEEKTFYNIDGTEALVPTMFKKFKIPYGSIESLNANFIKMQYMNEDFEIIIILPKEKYGLNDLEKKFNWDLISKADCSTEEVELVLPKFKVEATLDLKEVLQKVGINLMFEERANFSRIAEEPLFVSRLLQKVFIEVDEKGSEAAAATVGQMRVRRMIAYEEFTVDHPFMFVINYKPSSIPLFIGSIRKLGEANVKDEL